MARTSLFTSRTGRRLGAAAAGGTLLAGLALASPATAAPGTPSFEGRVYADGQAYGTKFTTALPGPRGANSQSFDALYAVTNGAAGQLAVAEAAPGSTDYNGGRWAVSTVTWTDAALALYGAALPVLTSDDELLAQEAAGLLTVTAGAPDAPGAPPDYFQCPLLPVK